MAYSTSVCHERAVACDSESPPEQNDVNKTAPPVLQAAGSAHLEQLPHHHAQIERHGKEQVPQLYFRQAAQPRSPATARLAYVSE